MHYFTFAPAMPGHENVQSSGLDFVSLKEAHHEIDFISLHEGHATLSHADENPLFAAIQPGGIIDALNLLGSIIFLYGSILWLPGMAVDMLIILWSFFIGLSCFIIVGVCKAYVADSALERTSWVLFFLGCSTAIGGFILYLPQYVDEYQYTGTVVLCVSLSMLCLASLIVIYIVAGLREVMGVSGCSAPYEFVSAAIEASLYSSGSILLLVASCLFLTDPSSPSFDSNMNLAGWLFVYGSIAYLVGALPPFVDPVIVACLKKASKAS